MLSIQIDDAIASALHNEKADKDRQNHTDAKKPDSASALHGTSHCSYRLHHPTVAALGVEEVI